MSDALHSLKHEHRVIERVLRALEGVSTRLEMGEQIPEEALTQIIDFIRAFTDAFHHHKEEAHLFPALGRQGIPHHGGPLSVIEYEHELERAFTAEMELAQEGFQFEDLEARARFVEAARNYSQHLISHIQKEDGILFRLADEVLSEEDKQSLSKAFEQEQKRLGEGALERYEQIASSLEERWAI